MQHLAAAICEVCSRCLAKILSRSLPARNCRCSGTYRGLAEVAGLFQKISEMLEISFLELREFVAQGDRVLVVGFSEGRVKGTNRTYEHHEVIAFTVRNGKVTNVREYIDTLALARAFEMRLRTCCFISTPRAL